MQSTVKDDVVADVKKGARNIEHEARRTADNVRVDLQEAANKAGREVRRIFSTATDELSHATDTVKNEIYNSPVRSTLIALGAGFVLGTLFRR